MNLREYRRAYGSGELFLGVLFLAVVLWPLFYFGWKGFVWLLHALD